MYSAEDLFTEDAEDDLERIVEGNHEDQGNEGGDGDNENDRAGDDNDDGNPAGDGAPAAAKPKRVVRNPQPKFNADTLRNPRGLLCLESLFDRVQFKGRGHEEQDLNVLMKTYEYWCHRMFPKFPFDDSIARLEKLGTKKPVQAYMKRVRLDMLTDSDERPELIVDPPEDEVDNDDDDDDHQFDSLLRPTESSSQSLEAQPWTDEQLRRLEENRRKAEMIKLEKLRKIQDKATSVLERSQTDQTADHATSSGDRNAEFPDEFDEIDDRINTQDDLAMEIDAEECSQESRQATQWPDEQLQRLEENRKRAERIKLERHRKIEDISFEKHQSTSNTSSACPEELCKTNEGVATNSQECSPQTSSSLSIPQECNEEFKSLDTQNNFPITGSSPTEVCSQEMFNYDNTESIAQESADLHKGSQDMDVDEMSLSNNEETLPASLVDPKLSACDTEDNFAINVSECNSSKSDVAVIANSANISNKDKEEQSEEFTQVYTNESDNNVTS